MEERINFKVGDRVYYPYYGLWSVIANYDDGRFYPIEVNAIIVHGDKGGQK